MKKEEEILLGALRQYRKNNEDVFISGYDTDEVKKIIGDLLKVIKAQDKLILTYRFQDKKVPEWVFKTLRKAREKGYL